MYSNSKPKIAVVIQRYGEEILGGESLCRSVVRSLQHKMNITVLTTCAKEYRTWKNEYRPGWEKEENLSILRFPVRQKRSMFFFKWLTRCVYLTQWLYNTGLKFKKPILKLQENWLKSQGPYCPDLVDFLKKNHDRYEVFIFFTYLYYPTAVGIEYVADKAILFPSAHDERPIYLLWFQKMFAKPRGLITQTPEEFKFINNTFKIQNKPQKIASMHIPTLKDFTTEQVEDFEKEMIQFLATYQLKTPFILYTGRIEKSKGAKWMLKNFKRFTREYKTSLQLVLIGQSYIKLPKHPQIKYLGFLSENDKRSAILGCKFFLMPSFFESFSISLLEAMGMGKPVIVNGNCSVLRGHVERSKGGFAVNNYTEFASACISLFKDKNNEYGTNGMTYVHENYTWSKVLLSYEELINTIRPPTRENPTETEFHIEGKENEANSWLPNNCN